MDLRFGINVDDKGNPAISRLGKGASETESIIKKLGVALAAVFTVEKIISWGKASIDAYDKQELAVTKLRTALGGTSIALIKQASALQEVTRFGDEATIEAQAMLATYGLTEDQILKLIPAVQNFASATGKDLREAADMAGKSITTTTNALQRNGITVANSIFVSERYDSILESLNNRFKDQAEAAGKAGAGPLTMLANKYGDLKENVGRNIVNFPIFATAIELANKALDIGQAITSDAAAEYKQLADDIDQKTLPALLDLNAELATTISAAPKAGMVLGSIPKFADPAAIESIAKSFKTVSAEADVSAVNIAASVQSIRASLAARAAPKDEKIVAEGAETRLKDIATSEYVMWDEIHAENLKNEEEYYNTLYELKAGLIEETEEGELDALMNGLMKKYDIELLSAEQLIALDEYTTKKRADIHSKFVLAKLNVMGQFFGGMAALTSQAKGLAGVSKALAITGAMIDTYAAATSVFRQTAKILPPPFPFLAAAGAVGFGLANVAQIKAQKVKSGTVYGNGGASTDNIPAWLSPGEEVLSGRDVRKLGGRAGLQAAINEGGVSGGMTFVFQNPIGEKRFFEDWAIPAFQKALARV